MHRLPDSEIERIEAARKVRQGLPPTADPAIVSFVTESFAPVDDAWNAARLAVANAAVVHRYAGERVSASSEGLIDVIRRIAATLVDHRHRADHAARKVAFGASLTTILRLSPERLVVAGSTGMVWLGAERPTEVAIRDELAAVVARLAADLGERKAAQTESRRANLALEAARTAWDASYRRLVKTVEFVAEDWKLYLAAFADGPARTEPTGAQGKKELAAK